MTWSRENHSDMQEEKVGNNKHKQPDRDTWNRTEHPNAIRKGGSSGETGKFRELSLTRG